MKYLSRFSTRLRPSTGALVLISAILAASPAQADLEGWLTDVGAAQTAARDSDRLLLVDLYAEWCSWCKVLDSKVFSTHRFQSYAADKFVLLRVDVEDEGEGQELAARFAITSLPVTLVLTPELVKAGQIGGFQPLERFIGSLDMQLALWAAFEQQVADAWESEDPAVLRTTADELHRRRDGARAAALYERVLAAGTDDKPFSVHFLLADSYRQAGELDEAMRALATAESMRSDDEVPPPVDEALRILRFQVVTDLGECAEARSAFETLLETHPKTPFRSEGEHSLAELESSTPCT